MPSTLRDQEKGDIPPEFEYSNRLEGALRFNGLESSILTKLSQHNLGEICELAVRIFGEIGVYHFRTPDIAHRLPERHLDGGIAVAR